MGIAVVGMYGCGKTTAAKQLATEHGLRYIHVDEIAWRNGRQSVELRDEIDAVTREPDFVTDALYTVCQDLMLDRAQLIAWLDIGFPTVVFRATRRALAGGGGGGVWTGQQVRPLRRLPPQLLVRALRAHTDRRRELERLLADRSEKVVRLTGRRAVNRWLRGSTHRDIAQLPRSA